MMQNDVWSDELFGYVQEAFVETKPCKGGGVFLHLMGVNYD